MFNPTHIVENMIRYELKMLEQGGILTVELPTELAAAVANAASLAGMPVEAYVQAALDRDTSKLNESKLQREQIAFTAMHAQLVKTHFLKFVAIHEGQLVGSSEEFHDLYHKMRAKYGRTKVLITQVVETPVRTFREPRSRYRIVRDN